MTLIALAIILEAIFLRIVMPGDLKPRIVETIGLLLLSGLFYLVCSFIIIRQNIRRKLAQPLMIGVAILFRLTFWTLYPALSDDVFRYRWEGKLQAAGGNPYEARPNDPQWRSLRDETFTSVPGRDFRAVYGPLIEGIERLEYRLVAAVEPRPFAQAFWFKVPSALFDLGVMAALRLLLKIKNLPPERLLIYAWSPLPLIEFWGTGHNDSIAVFFIVLALAAAAHRVAQKAIQSGDRAVSIQWIAAFASLTLAVAAKLWPIFLFPLFIAAAGWRRWRECLVALPMVALVALPYWTPTLHWSTIDENFRFMSGFLGGWRNNDSLFGALLWAAGNDFYLAKKLAFAVVCAAVAMVTLLRWPLERAALGVITTLLLVSANCHAWYLTWILPLLAIEAVPPLLLWTALAPLAHAAVIDWVGSGEWKGSTSLRYYEYVPVFIALAAWLVSRLGVFKGARARDSAQRPA